MSTEQQTMAERPSRSVRLATLFRPRFRRLAYLWDLLSELVNRDIKLRYKRSVLGLAWSLLNPLAQFVILNFVVHSVLPLNIPNYTTFLFTGILAWNWFQTALMLGTTAIVENRDLIRRPGFPPTVLPLIAVMSNLVHFLLALPILLIFVLASGTGLNASVLWLPVIIAVQFLLILSLTYFLASLHVTFRDTQYLLGILLLLGFYLTPVFYDIAGVSERFQVIYRVNLMMYIIDAYRAIFLRGETPNLAALAVITGIAITVLYISYRSFVRASYHFVEEL